MFDSIIRSYNLEEIWEQEKNYMSEEEFLERYVD